MWLWLIAFDTFLLIRLLYGIMLSYQLDYIASSENEPLSLHGRVATDFRKHRETGGFIPRLCGTLYHGYKKSSLAVMNFVLVQLRVTTTMEEKVKNSLKLICPNQMICQPSSESPPTHSRHFPEPVIHHLLEEH